MTKISLIIPVYDEAPYLRRCFDSVIAALPQDDSVEVIVVDDGSTDGSAEICDAYSDVDHFWIYHTVNHGVSAARNYGLVYSAGDWITFLDSDDAMNPDGIQLMLDAISKHGDNGHIIQFNHKRYYSKIDKLTTKYANKAGTYNCYQKLPEMWCMVWNKLYPRNLLEDNWIRFSYGMQFGEDELFNLHCIEIDPVIIHLAETTITRHFENKQSLAHTIDEEKLLRQTESLCELMRGASNPDFKRLIRWLLANHWDSKTYKKTFGE